MFKACQSAKNSIRVVSTSSDSSLTSIHTTPRVKSKAVGVIEYDEWERRQRILNLNQESIKTPIWDRLSNLRKPEWRCYAGSSDDLPKPPCRSRPFFSYHRYHCFYLLWSRRLFYGCRRRNYYMPVNKSLITVIVEAIGAGAALALIYNVLRVMHLNAYGADKMSMFLCPLAAFKLLQTVVSRFFTLQAPAASTIETDITVPNDKHLIPEEKVVFQTPDIAAKRTLQAASSGQFEHKEYAKVFPVNRIRVNPIIVNYNEAIDSVANFENESSPKVVESQEKSVPKTEDIVKIDSKTSDELPWIKYAKTFPAESPLVHPSEPLRWHPKGVLQSKVTNPSPIRSPSYIQEKIPQQIALDMDRTTQELMNVASGFQLAQALFGMYPIADENSVEKDKAENRVDGKKTQGKVSSIKRSYSMGNLREMF